MPTDRFEELRKQAEALVRNQPAGAWADTSGRKGKAPADILDLIHELNLHEAELEIQNDELRQAQKELSSLHREYEDLYEFAPCGYLTLNARGIITRVNLTSVRLLGSTRNGLLKSTLTPYINKGWENAFIKARRKAGETGQKQSIELPLREKEKEGGNPDPRWVHAGIDADRDENKAVTQWRIVLTDITSLKQGEKGLRESKEFLGEIIDSMPNHIAIIDNCGEIVLVNRSWRKFAEENGLKNDCLAMEGSNYLTVCDEVQGDENDRIQARDIADSIRKVLRKELDFFATVYPCHSPEKERWFEMSVTHIPHGDQVFAIISHNNITERKKAELELQKALEEIKDLKERLEEENIYLRDEIRMAHLHGNIVAESKTMRAAVLLAEQVAVTDSTVLIQGETGSGKELLARAVHAMSSRKNKPLIIVNCAALPAALVESELFGRERGAYTGALSKQIGRFELAHGGTVFLDEISEIPLETQVKLLRVLQEGEFERLGSNQTLKVDVRVIAATNRDLSQLIKRKRFRADLYYRLNVFPIRIPPLRERREDISTLVWEFVREFSLRMGKKIESIPKPTMLALEDNPWPGNVRELRNAVERAMILAKGPSLTIPIPDATNSSQEAETRTDEREDETTQSTPTTLDDLQRQHILKVLEKTGWRVRGKQGAAAILGLKESTLRSRMARLGIKRPG